MEEFQRIITDFAERADRIAFQFGAQVHTVDTSMALRVLVFYITYSLPGDEESTATGDGSTPDQALAIFRDVLVARTSNTAHARLSLN